MYTARLICEKSRERLAEMTDGAESEASRKLKELEGDSGRSGLKESWRKKVKKSRFILSACSLSPNRSTADLPTKRTRKWSTLPPRCTMRSSGSILSTNIRSSRVGCMQGLLVKLSDTSTGYAITNEEANKLRDILGE